MRRSPAVEKTFGKDTTIKALMPILELLSTALFKQQKYSGMKPFVKRALALNPTDDSLINMHSICLMEQSKC